MKDWWLRGRSNALIIVAAILGLALLVLGVWSGSQPRGATMTGPPIAVNVLAARLKAGEVASMAVAGDIVVATTTDGDRVWFAPERGASVPQLLASFGVSPEELIQVTYTVREQGAPINWPGLAGAVLTIAAVTVLVLRRTHALDQQPGLSFLRSRPRLGGGDTATVTFADVAGVEEAKQELTEVVAFLKEPDRFEALGARIPKGVLLIGPPGTGKTLLARAVAGEAEVPFFSIAGSEFVELFVGVGASRVRDLFAQAKRHAPCIVFIDEIDAVGRQRGTGRWLHEDREQALNQILVEMDGFASTSNVIVMAATNRPDVLDPALVRPGRFDRQVVLPTPDLNGRQAILAVHAKGKPFDQTVSLGLLAKQTPGFSGADLANLLNEAAILAVRRHKQLIGMRELEAAIDRVVAGPECTSRVLSEQEKALTAYHEAGHAVVGRFLPHHDPVHKVTIIAHGLVGGYTRFLPAEDRHYLTKSQLEDLLASALGGQAAEVLVFGEMSTGAANDIAKATTIARKMVTECGMSERLGPVALGQHDDQRELGSERGEHTPYSETVAEAIDAEIRCLLDAAQATAVSIIREHRDVLERLVQELIRVETVEGEDLERIFRGASSRGDREGGLDCSGTEEGIVE